METALSYCGQQVRDFDPDRFLLSMFAPPDRREALWALFAFNLEIAKTREVVSETQLGLIRLQWWRDAITKIFERGDVPEHEVLKVLRKAIEDYNLPKDPFDTLVYAREFDLETVCPANLDGLLNYADFTSTPLMNLALRICGDDPDMDPVPVVAANYALVGLLRSVPFHAQQRRCYLPEDLMKKHNVTLTQMYDFMKPEAGLRDVVKEIAAQFVPGARPDSRLLKATQVLAEIYMRQIRRRKYDIWSPKMAVSPAFKALRLTLWTTFG
jgi:NADH dehydrogenase [ubiquinone] 1 alpha subcomplex assembly factor 6